MTKTGDTKTRTIFSAINDSASASAQRICVKKIRELSDTEISVVAAGNGDFGMISRR